MAYRHNDALYKHKKQAHRVKRLAIGFSVFAILASVVIGVDWVLTQMDNSNTIISRENTTSVQSANVSVYRTEFFQFQASEEWVAVAGQSSDKMFTYVKNDGSLITKKMVVYVDRPATAREADFKVTHVLPVESGELGRLVNIGQVSSHCDDSWPEDLMRNPSRITHASVSFVCSPSSQQYNVVVGEYDGDEEIELVMNDGREVTFTIIYSDLTAYPGPGDIYNIVSSFSAL